MSTYIAATAHVSDKCTICHNVVILDSAVIGDDVYLGNNVVVHEGCRIGSGTYIDDGAIMGRKPRKGSSMRSQLEQDPRPLEIGDDCIISAHVILYEGITLGDRVMVGDLASVREGCTVGNDCVIGRLVSIEPRAQIRQGVRIQTGSHITADIIIENGVFIGSEIATTNDNSMGRGTRAAAAPHIKERARIGSNATLLPGVTIGREAIVAAGSVVTRDVPDGKLVMGAPARIIRDVRPDEMGE